MQQVDVKHSSTTTSELLNNTKIKVLEWLSQSPDLNWNAVKKSGTIFLCIVARDSKKFWCTFPPVIWMLHVFWGIKWLHTEICWGLVFVHSAARAFGWGWALGQVRNLYSKGFCWGWVECSSASNFVQRPKCVDGHDWRVVYLKKKRNIKTPACHVISVNNMSFKMYIKIYLQCLFFMLSINNSLKRSTF